MTDAVGVCKYPVNCSGFIKDQQVYFSDLLTLSSVNLNLKTINERHKLQLAARMLNTLIILFIVLFFQYVDHIKFCSKFRTPCRFHVVGCDMSVSSLIVLLMITFLHIQIRDCMKIRGAHHVFCIFACSHRWKRKRFMTTSAPTPTSTSICCCTTLWA